MFQNIGNKRDTVYHDSIREDDEDSDIEPGKLNLIVFLLCSA